jgi:hypothetical protein
LNAEHTDRLARSVVDDDGRQLEVREDTRYAGEQLLRKSDESAMLCVMKRVAVMQPYFFPYAGYFRFFAAVDHFVIFDCVQFPRRGHVHRTQVPGPSGENEWLSLPLARQSREVLIRDLEFAADARERFDERLARHPWIERSRGRAAARIRDFLFGPLDAVDDFLERGLRLVGEILELPVMITRSSALRLTRG